MPNEFKADKVLANLKILASLCLKSSKDKLKAMDQTGLFRISKNATGVLGFWGRKDADSITGALGDQIVKFFEFAKQNSYKRETLPQTVQINSLNGFDGIGISTNMRPIASGISYRGKGTEVRLLGNVAIKSDFDNALAGLKRMRVSYSSTSSTDKLARLNEIITRVETVMSTFTGGTNINYAQWAQTACEHARSTMIYKSTNKVNVNRNYKINGESLTALQKRDKAIPKLAKLHDLLIASNSYKIAGDSAAQAGVGNCGEQRGIAANFLLLNKITPLVLCSLAKPGDHAFVAIGPGVSHLQDWSNHGIQCGNFNVWPKGIYICDPWANIHCESKEYTSKFYNKMREWESKGKQLRGFGQIGSFDPSIIANCLNTNLKVFDQWFI